MICSCLKECIDGTEHVAPKEDKAGKKGKKKGAGNKKIDLYQQPLCPSPCANSEQQKKCIGFIDCRSRAVCAENGKSYTLDQGQENPKKEMAQLHIDGGVITNPEANRINKCDYALILKDKRAVGEKRTAILIELKGTDVSKALEQLTSTLSQKEFAAVWNSCARVYGRIVCKSSPPRLQSTGRCMTVKEEFLKRGGNLKFGEVAYVEEYKDL